jgi:DNA-binding MarR family transcriptional regulator
MNAAAPTSVCVSYNLRKASRIVSKVYAREMQSAPVRGPQFSLMMMIARRQSPTISELARDTGADRTTMTRNLDQLQKKGLIRVTQGKNMRTKAVELAPKGKVALERSISYWQKAQAKVLKTLGEERWNRMLNDLAVLSTLPMQSNNAIKA